MGAEPGPFCADWLSWVLWISGYPDELRAVEAKILLGWAQSELGDVAGGTALLESALGEWTRMGTAVATSLWYSLLALSYARASRFDNAHSAMANALDFINRTGERFVEAEAYRIRGHLHAQSNARDRAAAEQDFLKAMDVERSQGARMIERRAATSLVQLWRSRGKEKEGITLVRPIYDTFTEGFDTKDLKRAKAVPNGEH